MAVTGSANSPKKGKNFGKFWIKTKLTPFTYWTFCFAITGYWVQVTIQNVHWKLMVGVCLREIKKNCCTIKRNFLKLKANLVHQYKKIGNWTWSKVWSDKYSICHLLCSIGDRLAELTEFISFSMYDWNDHSLEVSLRMMKFVVPYLDHKHSTNPQNIWVIKSLKKTSLNKFTAIFIGEHYRSGNPHLKCEARFLIIYHFPLCL